MDIAHFIFSVALAYFSYTLLFFAFILGIFIPVIPEELVLLLAGFLTYLKIMNYWLVIPIAIAGIILADIITYSFGRRKGRDVLFMLGVRYRIFGKLLHRGERLFNRYDDRAVIFGRFILGARFVVPLLAGAFRMSWRRFLHFSLVGSCIWAITAITVGYYIGMTLNWALLIDGERIIYALFGIFVILYALVYLVKRKLFKI